MRMSVDRGAILRMIEYPIAICVVRDSLYVRDDTYGWTENPVLCSSNGRQSRSDNYVVTASLYGPNSYRLYPAVLLRVEQ